LTAAFPARYAQSPRDEFDRPFAPMPHLDRVKRQLVSEVVRENVETLHGLPPRSLRRARRRMPRAALRAVGLILAPSLLFVAMSALSTGQADRPAALARPVGPPPPPDAVAAPASFPAPQALDPAAFPLEVRKIVLDPGHGGSDPGARTAGGIWEKEITLDVAQRLRPLLVEAGFDVLMTREKDETVSLRERAQFANYQRGDLFVSIHFNALATRSYRGLETYYLGATSDKRVERLAGAENQASGYSLSDFKRLLEGVYTHVRQEESKQLAEAVHRGLSSHLIKGNPAVKDSGVKPAPFLVLVATEMPGILAEVSYLSNEEDAKLLAEPSYRSEIARALFQGLRGYTQARIRPAVAGASR
jgi:N-acetylmuramoyl-L-alanine amidase